MFNQKSVCLLTRNSSLIKVKWYFIFQDNDGSSLLLLTTLVPIAVRDELSLKLKTM